MNKLLNLFESIAIKESNKDWASSFAIVNIDNCYILIPPVIKNKTVKYFTNNEWINYKLEDNGSLPDIILLISKDFGNTSSSNSIEFTLYKENEKILVTFKDCIITVYPNDKKSETKAKMIAMYYGINPKEMNLDILFQSV